MFPTVWSSPERVSGIPRNGKIDEDNLSRHEVINPSLHIGNGSSLALLNRDYMSMQQARQDTQAGYNENVEKTEAGVFSSDLTPAEVLSNPRPASEFYFMLGVSKRF